MDDSTVCGSCYNSSMKTAMRISPDEFIVSVLSREERLDAAISVVRQAFRRATLKVTDVERAVRRIRSMTRRAGRQGRMLTRVS